MKEYLTTIGGEFRFARRDDTLVVTSYIDNSFEEEYKIPDTIELDDPEMSLDRVLYDVFYEQVRSDFAEHTK